MGGGEHGGDVKWGQSSCRECGGGHRGGRGGWGAEGLPLDHMGTWVQTSGEINTQDTHTCTCTYTLSHTNSFSVPLSHVLQSCL